MVMPPYKSSETRIASAPSPQQTRVFVDLTHVGRHVTGIERVAIEQFEKVDFAGAELSMIRARGVVSMIFKQQILLPLLAILYPRARFVFPGFPPSPFFSLIANRTTLYVHDTFLLTRRADLSTKARLYMAPQFAFAVRRLKHFLVNSEKTAGELRNYVRGDAGIRLYRPMVANHFGLETTARNKMPAKPSPLRLVSLGTVEPRKNYAAALAILNEIRTRFDPGAELHIIGRAGWGDVGAGIAGHPGVIVHGYLPADRVKAVLEAADIYLCTSHDEGLGLPLLEAQFAGLPIVAPDQSVFLEVLAASGTFIATNDPTKAANAIGALVAESDWRNRQAAAAIHNVLRWNTMAERDLAEARLAFSSSPHAQGGGSVVAEERA
jgi:glycosyltransferase involved in cell wall biosynthesis